MAERQVFASAFARLNCYRSGGQKWGGIVDLKSILERKWRNFVLSCEDKILTVQLNTEGFERNDFNGAVIAELAELAVLLHRNIEFNVVLLCGRADVFSAGSDPQDFRSRFSAPTLLERRRDVMPGADMIEAWSKIEAITIAAIDGRCRGAACVLSIVCDFRIMGEGVEFFFPEVPNGMILGWGAIPRLTALVGPSRCKQMVMFGDAIDAKTSADWGLADEIAPAGEALAVGKRWAQKIAQLPALAVRMTKESVDTHSTALQAMSATADRNRYLLAGQVRVGLMS